MSQLIDTLLTDLRTLIADLGKDGGLISPSVYDTAQVLRFCPPEEGVEPALEWILRQQQPDGGWGNPAVPLSRHMPTLASVLALRTYKKINPQKIESCIEAGIEFLGKHANEWLDAHIDDYPIAVEVVLPKLLEDAQALDITLPREPYAELMKLGNKKRRQIAQMKPTAGTPPTYSWEAWGINPTTDVVDAIGSVGTSPAATAAWVYAAQLNPDLADTSQKARCYLKRASAATGMEISGVVPTVFPINLFEKQYGLYTLVISGLVDHPVLQNVVKSQAQDIAANLRPNGTSYSSYFTSECDDTAASLIALQAMGYKVNPLETLSYFKNSDYYVTFRHELNPSIFTNARAVHALARANQKVSQPLRFLLERQLTDGRWPADKWHSSWLYTMLETIQALTFFDHSKNLELACNALLHNQHTDGGWGVGSQSTSSETAYIILTLHTMRSHVCFSEVARKALQRGYKWLLNDYDSFTLNNTPLWVAKELYCPYRVDRIFKISAILAITMKEVSS